MVQRCVIFGCGNQSTTGVALHEFPSSKAEREQWRRFVCRTRSQWDGPTKYSVVCSRHFLETQFDNLMAYQMGMAKKLRLKKTAVPTVYPDGTCRTQASSGRGKAPPERTSAMRKREVIRVRLQVNKYRTLSVIIILHSI